MTQEDPLMDELIQLRKKIFELERNESLFRTTEETGKVGGWQFDPITFKQTWTDEVFRILEIDLEQGAPEVPKGFEFIDPAFRPMAEKAIQQAMEHGEPYNQEWIVTTAKGNKKWVNAVCSPKLENGILVSISGSFQDITSKKIAEEVLKMSEQSVLAANQQLQAGEQQLKAANQQLSASEQQLRAANQQLQASEQQLRAANQQLQASEQQLRAANQQLSANEQQLIYAKEKAEEHLAMFQAAMENSQAGIAIAEVPSGKLTYVNKAALLIRDKDYDKIVNNIDVEQYVESWQILHLDGTPYNTDEVPLAKAVLYGERSSKEFIVRRDNNEDRHVWANAAPVLLQQLLYFWILLKRN